MTTIKILRKNGLLFAVEAKGHSGYKNIGSDIVCSAVSTALQGAALGLVEVAKANLKQIIHDGYLYFEILNGHSDASSAILETMYLTLKDISQSYKSYIKLELEEINNDEN